MRLIAILLSLWANRHPEWLDKWRRSEPLFQYADWLRQRVLGAGRWQSALGLAAFVIPPLLVVVLLQWWLGGWLLGLAIAVAALLFAHGPGRVDDDLEEFLSAWEQEDMPRAQRAVQALSGTADSPAAGAQLPQEAIHGLYWQCYQRLLGPIFWFVLLGAWGAVLFRLAYIAEEYASSRHEEGEPFERAVRALLFVLDWVPARLAALAFGLAGSFVHAMQGWRANADDDDHRQLVLSAADGALNMPLNNTTAESVTAVVGEARSLVTRTVLCWLAVVALSTIFGWLG